jgi:hypothetical protein
MRRDELKQTRGRLKPSLTRALEAVDTLDVTVANEPTAPHSKNPSIQPARAITAAAIAPHNA